MIDDDKPILRPGRSRRDGYSIDDLIRQREEEKAQQEREALRGLQGETGKDGSAGERGPMGPMGPKGDTGPIGMTGKQGPEGPQGERGLQGSPGKDGKDGQDGRDGKDGQDGINGINAPTIQEIIKEVIKKVGSRKVVISGGNSYNAVLDPPNKQKGDLLVYNGNKWVRLEAPSTDGLQLTSDASEPTGLRWGPLPTDVILLENGDRLLLETGDGILLE